MDRNLAIGLGIAVLVVAGLAGVAFYNSNMNVATVTPPDQQQTVDLTPEIPSAGRESGAPVVTTDENATPSNSTAVVTGRVLPNGAQTSYWFEYGRNTSLGNRTSAQGIGSGFIQINAPGYITGLSPNTTYYYRLSAKNSFGTVNGNTHSFTTNNNPPPAGRAPTARTEAAIGIERTAAVVKGSANPGGAQTSYWFEYGETRDLGNTTVLQSAGSGSTATEVSASLSDLRPLTRYFYRLNAQNQYGTVNGLIMSFTTNGPAEAMAPSTDTTAASGVNRTSATLNGRVNPNGETTTYWFEYGADNLLGAILGSTSRERVAGAGTAGVAVAANINGLSADTRYFYRLIAQNSRGTTRGDIVEFRTNP